MLIIPAIDLKDGRCVRLLQGRKSDVKVYDADPVEMARAVGLCGSSVACTLSILTELSPAANQRIERWCARLSTNVNVPVEFGGGLRSIADVMQVIALGVERVVIGTMAAESTEVLKVLVNRYDALICAGIDARDGKVMTRGWENATDLSGGRSGTITRDAGYQADHLY